jgi:hypothetical protein
MGIFRLAFAVLFVFVMVSVAASLLGGAATAGMAAIGALMFLPVLIFKGLFLLVLFGFFARKTLGRTWGERPQWQRRPTRPEVSTEERFDEWHRMAHARDEVDSWTPEVDV